MVSTHEAPALRSNGDFAIYWAGQALSSLGDGFATVATPLLVLEATGAVTQLGAVTAATTCGQLVAALGAGLVVDRVDRRLLMIACDVARALLWALVPLCWLTSRPSMPLLFAVATAAALAGNVFYVACFTAVPSLVRREDVVAANSRLHGTFALMGLVGPLLSGIVCGRYGAAVGVAINAASFVVSAGAMALVRLRRDEDPDAPPSVTESAVRAHGRFASSLAGARFLWRTPLLRAAAISVAATALLTTARNDLVIFHLQRDIRVGPDSLGAVLGVAGLGAVLASALAPRVHRRAGLGGSWLIAGMLAGLPLACMASMGGARSAPAMAALLVVASFGDTLRGIASQSLRHHVTPDRILGRVTAAFWAVVDLPAALGAVSMTALAAEIGALRALGIAGVGTLGAAVLAWARFRRFDR